MPSVRSTEAAPVGGGASGPATGPRLALLAAKLSPPDLAHATVPRPRLLAVLSRAVQRTPLTVISGPAGSGKTALAASWRAAERGGRRVAWLTLDDYDNDPASFWSYVVEALAEAGLSAPDLPALLPGEPPPSGFVPMLAAALTARQQPVVLILDNADHVSDPAVISGLDLLIRHAGSRLRLLMCARADPQLPLHQYRLAGTMAEIRGHELAFTPDETRDLLAAMGVQVTAEVAGQLCAETQGWAAGLRLAATPLKRGLGPEHLATSLAHDDGSVAQYLFAEVLAGQPANVRRFLLRISVTEELWPDLVDRLSGRPHGRRMLAALARANAFVEESPGAPGGYRIHPLFREMLLAQLGYEHPGEVAGLRRACAAWYAARGMVPEAVGHAVAAGEWAFVARLLVDDFVVARLLAHGADPALRGVPRLPSDLDGPDAAVLRAAMAVAAGDRPRGTDLAAAAAADDGARPALRVSAALTCLAAPMVAPADLAQLSARLAVAEAAASDLPEDRGKERRDYLALLATARGLAAVCGDGPVEQIVTSLRAAAGAAQTAGARRLRARALALLAVLDAVEGELARASRHALEVEALGAEAGTADPDRSMAAALALAWLHVERYSLVEGRDWLARAATRGRSGIRGPEERALVVILAVLQSRSLRLRREHEAADECLRAHLADAQVPRWARRQLLAEAARVAVARGRVHEAVLLADADDVDPAARTRLHALARLLGDDGGDGPVIEVGDAGPAAAVESRVLRSCQLADAGAVPAAADELVRALDLARPELLRLPFLEAPAQARRLLRTHPRLADPARWLDPSVPARAVARGVGPATAPVDELPALTQELSERETEVLQHLAAMLSTSEIAATMFISVNTVRTHIRSILRKLGVSRRNQAVRRARERGLL